MPSIHFTVTAEDKNLQKVLADIEKGVQSTSEKVEKSGLDIDAVLSKITKGAAAVGVAFSAQQLVKKISDVRGEFQQLEVAFNTILGSEQKATALMAQLTETAAVTPFGLQEVAGSAKQLLAYGVAAEEVNERLVMLGDIASGLSIPLSDLAYLYGTTMTQGRMYTQDLNQFMGRGIPIADELAKQFGVTKDKVKELVTAGKIGFEEMHKSLVAMTSEGGKFGGLMEAQSKTIKGQISNLEDAIDVMFNEIGKTQEGVFNTALSTASKLVENYEEVGKILMGIVATYGAYKGALIAFTTIQKVESAIVAQAAVQKSLAALAGHQLSASQARGAAVAQLYSAAQAKVAASLKAVTAASWANPYALITAAVVGLVSSTILLTKKLDEQTGAYNRVKKAGEDYASFLKTWEQNAKDLISIIQSETSTNADRIRAYEELAKVMPGIVELYSMEELALIDVANANKEVTKQVEIADKKGREIQKKNLQKVIDDYEDRIKAQKAVGRGKEAKMIASDPQYIQAKKELEELKKLDEKIKEATSTTPAIKNRKYWEDMKNDAELALKEMDSKLKGTDVWNALENKIKQAELELEKYSVTKSSSDLKTANELEAKKAEYKLALEKYKQEIIQETESVQMEIRQAEINAMDDGMDKVLAQIDLNYDKQVAENKKRKQELIDIIAEQKAEQWAIENPKLAEKGQKFDKSIVTEADLTQEQKAILAFYDLLAKKERNLAQENETKQLLSNYQTYMQKRKEVYLKYEADMAAMKYDNGEYREGFSSANEAILNKEREEALSAVDVEFAMKEEQFSAWANSISGLTLNKLNDLLEEAEVALEEAKHKVEYGEVNEEELQKYLAAVAVLKEAKKNLNLTPEQKAEKDWKDLYKVLGDISSQFENIGQEVGGTAGEIISLAGTVSTGIMSMIDGVKSISKSAAKELEAVEKASVILGIISTAINLLQKINKLTDNRAFREYEGYAEKIKEINALTDAVNEYKVAVLEASIAENNWFSENNLKSLRDYKKLQDEVFNSYMAKLTEAQAIYQNKSGGGWFTNPINWAMGNMSILSWWDDWKDIWGQGGYDKGTTAAINNLRIETRKASKGFLGSGIGGKSQKTKDLIEWAREQGLGELFDKDGMINKELAQSIIENYGDKLVGQTKETLEALIKLKEQYDEYIQQLRDYVKSLYEPLVDNFVDSLWSWFDEGKDALDSFKDYASDTFRDIVSDMMKTIVLEKVVGSFSDDIAALYEEYSKGVIDEAELMKRVSERTGDLVTSYEEQIPTLQNMMDLLNSYLEDAGISLKQSDSTEQKATYGGFESMSEETGSELNGRFTALQMAGEEIKNQMISSVVALNALVTSAGTGNSLLTDILTQHAITNAYLEDIVKYAKIASGFGVKLDKIVEQTKVL